MSKKQIVKGGESVHYPFGTYRMGYDIVQDGATFYLSVMNGSLEIFKGPNAASLQEAEATGVAALKLANPRLAVNVGIL